MTTFFTNEVTIFISFEVSILMAAMGTCMDNIVLGELYQSNERKTKRDGMIPTCVSVFFSVLVGDIRIKSRMYPLYHIPTTLMNPTYLNHVPTFLTNKVTVFVLH